MQKTPTEPAFSDHLSIVTTFSTVMVAYYAILLEDYLKLLVVFGPFLPLPVLSLPLSLQELLRQGNCTVV